MDVCCDIYVCVYGCICIWRSGINFAIFCYFCSPFFFFEAGSLTGPIVCCLGWNDWIKTGLYLSLTLTRYTRIRSMHHHDYKFCSCCRSKLSSLSLHRYSVSLLRLGKVQICSQKCVEAILKYRCHCFSFSFPPPPIYYTPQSKKGF